MKKITYLVLLTLIGCTSKTNKTENIKKIEIDSIKPVIQIVDTVIQERFIDFPIPKLDSIFKFSTSSGMVANSPSKKFYNPNDSGIFVFYILNYRKA
ncbi:hypothetical protein WAF17_12645 [Bernardetia sp. ABR2-2B]|uniref:hypothetical protein n=1 Tax=Bernardetia sp. ABR2-2B TaxID=3127472 RepID=UPI0030CAECF5